MRATWLSILSVTVLLFALTLFAGQNVHAATSNAAITTDQSDYLTGSTVTISGTGFSASASVSVSVTDPNLAIQTWSVSSDSSGSFTTTYLLDHVNGNYLVDASDGTNSASTTFHDAAAAANIDQCTNGAVGSPPESCLNSLANWVNGNANGNKAHWQEGDFIAYRVTITGETAGSHNIQFSWDTIHSSGHAIDYIGSVNYTETFSNTATPFHANNNNPCTDKLPAAQCSSSLSGFNSASSPTGSIAIPTANEATAATCDSATGTFSGTQIPGSIFIWGPTGTGLTSLSYVSENTPSGTGQCTTTAQLNFNIGGSLTSNTVVIAWGGHIASETNWGPGNSAGSISGSPYHTSLVSLDGASVGSQDRALSTTAIFFTPTISTTVINDSTGLTAVSPLSLGTSVHDTAALSAASATPTGTVTYKFYTNGLCSGTPSTTQTVNLSGGLIPNSASTGPLRAGSYSYNATYSGDGINFPKQPNSACEPFTVNPAATTTSTAIYRTGTKSPDLQGTTQTAGISVYDNATVSPKVDSIPITGTVTFTFYTSSDCTTGGTSQAPVALTSASPFSAASNSHVLSTPGTYSFRAVYSGDSNYNASTSSCEIIHILSAPNQPTITKTATASFTRTYTWTITKAVDQTIVDIALGGTATFHYTIVATGTTTDTNFQTSGTITVGNPNSGSIIITSVTDVDSNGAVCVISTGSLGDSPSGPFTLAAGANEMFPYTCTFSSNPGTGTDTATVAWPNQNITNTTPGLSGGTKTAPASYNFSNATITTVGSATVTVTDTLPDSTVDTLGTCTAPNSPGSASCTFTDSFTTGGVGGTCTLYTNTAALSTGQSASKTVQVCVGKDLTVSKTASASFTRTFTWSIMKNVDKTEVNIAQGGTATFTYSISATGTSTDSSWQVTGSITVTNPNDWEAITTTVTDATNNGGSCTVTGGVGVSIPASSSVTLPYTCTYSSAPSSTSGTNTATATWNSATYFTPDGTATGSASFAFTSPTTSGPATVTVTDTRPDGSTVTLGTCSAPNPASLLATNPSSNTCNYTDTFSTGGVGGTCTTYTNTATIVETSQSSSKTVTVCVGLDLTVSKTATPSFTRTYLWTISKTVDNNRLLTAGGSAATFNYHVTVTNTGFTDSLWAISGTITVSNPNDWEAITLTSLTDSAPGGVCTVAPGPYTVPASGSINVSYSCTLSSGASGTNTATATWNSSTNFTPTGSASGSAGFSFTTPTTFLDTNVSVTDSVVGPLGVCFVSGFGLPSSPCTFNYSKSYSDQAGTCTSHDNTAMFTTSDTHATGSASQTVTDCQGANLTVSKTATPSFTRTYTWGISKTVDNNNLFSAGGSPVTFNYHVTVTNTGFTDSLWAISGTITVSNPNDWESITLTSLSDSAPGGTCTVAPGPYVVPASSSISISYSCTFTSGASGTNTATAMWDATVASTTSGTASGSASFSFTTPTTSLDTNVAVTDSVVGPLGTCYVTGFGLPSSPCTFNYSKTYSDPAATCTSHDNTATFTTSDTHATGSASQTVTDCQGANLTISKTATPSFTRTFHWNIAKSVDNSNVFTAGGSPVTATYTVAVTHDAGTDSAWAISGTIVVSNPNNWEAITFNLSDFTTGNTGVCSITGGSGPYTVAAGSSMSFPYTCTFSSGSSGSNNAMATWDSSAFHTPTGSAVGNASFAFTTPTTIVDGSVSVSDSVQGFLGTVSYTDASPKTFSYSQTFTDPAGTCTSHPNTATFTTSDTGTTGSASQTVTDCQGADLTVSKTATPTFTRTFQWAISKTVDNNQIFTAGGAPGTVTYNVIVTHDSGTDSAWATTGTITVTNPNNWESVTFNLADLATGGSCTITGGIGPYTVAASSSSTFSYSCTFSSGASGTNTATATWDSSVFHTPTGSASGSASFAFTSPTTIVDGSVTVTDTQGGTLGVVSYTGPNPTVFTYSQTFNDPAGTCTSHTNTATFITNTTDTTGSASQTVSDCQGANLTVSKTASSTFTRTYHWGISKTADNSQIYTAGGGPGTVTYTVSVTHDAGTDSAWTITGTITVSNPNDWEAITTTVTDSTSGNVGSCSVTGGVGVVVPASGSVTLSYTCTFTSGASGTNTATATWNASTYHTPSGTASGSASFAFTTPTTIVDGTVSVSDSVQGFIGTVSYTDTSPKTFSYSQTFTDPAGTCTSHSNTATFTTNTTGTTGSASQTVTDCQGANLTVSKSASSTFARTFHWGISKTVDNNQIFTAGGGPGTVTYSVIVTHDSGTDSAWAVSGTITVTNPNDWEAITFNLADFTTGNAGVCSITGGSGPYTVAASSSMSFTYTCTFSSGASGSNTATATWDSSVFHTPTGSASGSASFAFTTPTSIVDGTVSVSDSVQGFLGTVSYTDASPKTFTYSQTFTDPAGTCTSHTNTATFTTNNTGTTGSSSQTVSDCQGANLTVTKTATTSFTRTFTWSISKSVDKTLVYLAPSGTATFTYTVGVTHNAGVDSMWKTSGTITVTNPNNWESVTLSSITDLVDNGGSCTVASGTMTVPASGSVTFSYTCTYASAPSPMSGTNTATAMWSASTFHTTSGSASGSATFTFAGPTTIVDGSATVTDTLFGGTLGTASATGAACTHAVGVTCTDVSGGTNFVYSHTVTPPSGTCVTVNNTATFTTNTTGTTGSAGQTVQACVVTSQINTHASPLTTSMPRTATDTATVTLSPSGQTVSGTVKFVVYGPFSSAPTSTSCTGSGVTLGTVNIGPGASPQSVTSPSFTPSSMGYYAFVATYTPAGVANGNSVSTSCADPNETLLVSPQSQVTNTSFCPIQNNQFPLNLITDPQNPGAFQLVSTNPGQFYDNVFYFDGAGNAVTLTIAIPYPFVTQGAVPIQVSSSFGIVNGCFSPSFDATSNFAISATGGTLSSSGNPIVVLGDYSSQQLGQYVYVTVTGTVPSSGLVYVTVHMSYGLDKQDFNKVTTGTASGTPTGISCSTNPCAQLTTNSAVIIGSPEPYAFSVTGNLTTTYTVTSVNNFKKDPGFAGVLTNADGSPMVGATVKVYDKTGTLIGVTTTDQNGVYLLPYKYTGPSTTFTIKVISPTGVTQTQTVTMKSNQLVLANFQFA